jgi:hypothetical protein
MTIIKNYAIPSPLLPFPKKKENKHRKREKRVNVVVLFSSIQ